MITGILEEAKKATDIIEGKIRVAISVIQVVKTNKDKFSERTDNFGNKIRLIEHKGEWCELMGESKNKEKWVIRVNRDDYPKAYPLSLPYFVLPPELEEVLGARTNTLTIVVSGETPEEYIPNDHKKYTGGALWCSCNGVKGRRFNDITQEWQEVRGICAYSKEFQDEIPNSINLDTAEDKRVWEYAGKKRSQVQYQGAWRDITGFNKESNTAFLEPLLPTCEPRYLFKFLVPDAGGLKLYMLDGGGRVNLRRLINFLEYKVRPIFGRVSGIPIELKTRLEETNIKGIGKRRYPAIYLNFPFDVRPALAEKMKRDFLITMGNNQTLPPADTHALPAAEVETIEEAEIEDVDESIDVEKLWEQFKSLCATLDREKAGQSHKLVTEKVGTVPTNPKDIDPAQLKSLVSFLTDKVLPF